MNASLCEERRRLSASAIRVAHLLDRPNGTVKLIPAVRESSSSDSYSLFIIRKVAEFH